MLNMPKNQHSFAEISIGSILAAHRRTRGLSLKQLSRITHIDDRTLTAYERDECKPSLTNFFVLVKAFGAPFLEDCIEPHGFTGVREIGDDSIASAQETLAKITQLILQSTEVQA